MSLVRSRSINCPSCRASMNVQLYESVNVSLDPGLKDRVLNRNINSAKCSNCDQDVEVVSDLLYHDMSKELMVWLRRNNDQNGELPTAPMTLRIVRSYEALIEKVLIYDTEIDDCVFELLKLVLWPQVSGRESDEYQGHEIRFAGANGDSLSFVMFESEGNKNFLFPKSAALELVPMAVNARTNAPAGTWCVVDREFILGTWQMS